MECLDRTLIFKLKVHNYVTKLCQFQRPFSARWDRRRWTVSS